MIFTDDGDDGFGVVLLMEFESESDRDGVEVAIEQGFVTTLENVTFNAIESGKGNEDVQESVSDREPCMILSIASIAKKTRKARRKQDW